MYLWGTVLVTPTGADISLLLQPVSYFSASSLSTEPTSISPVIVLIYIEEL